MTPDPELDMWHAFQCPGHTGTGLVFDVRVPETVLLETAKCPVCGRECRLRARWEATDRGYGGLGELTAAGEVELQEREERSKQLVRQLDADYVHLEIALGWLMMRCDSVPASKATLAVLKVLRRALLERDEARAEAARLAELHQRCEAYDDQPGPSCVQWRARAEKAEAALATLKGQATS